MKHRVKLQTLLENILGSRNVYFQPPENIQLKYPCIIYELDNLKHRYADDSVYFQSDIYSITVIDKDPESSIVDKVSLLPTCRFDRQFKSDNLYHTVFTIHY